MSTDDRARRAVFLDRDGVLTETRMVDGRPEPPLSAGELVLTTDAVPATRRLHEAGWLIVVVTNQPDVARGRLDNAAVEAMHVVLRRALTVDAVYWCPHDTSDHCNCRKPRPGMLLAAARDHAIDLGASWLIGDRWVDVAAAVAAGVQGILLERPYSWEPTSAGAPPENLRTIPSASSLTACIDIVLGASETV